MNSPVDERILDKIRKVQGYLQSNDPNEAAVAAAKLSEMLLRYNLTLSDIPREERAKDPFVNITTDAERKRMPEWRITLGYSIAKANLCKVITRFR